MKERIIGQRIRTILFNGVEVQVLDYSNLRHIDEMKFWIQKGLDFTHSLNKNDLLILIDVTNTHFNRAGYELIKEAATKTKLVTKQDAIVGIDSLSKRLLLNIMNLLRQTNTRAFNTQEDALEYLARFKRI